MTIKTSLKSDAIAHDLSGLAVKRGLAIWKDVGTYQRYLRKFVCDYAGIVEQIQYGTSTDGVAMAHKLKGAAGCLALEEVASCAAQVEKLLSSDKGVSAALGHLRTAMVTALNSISQYVPTSLKSESSTTEPFEINRVALLLSQLLAACDTDGMRAVRPILDRLEEVTPPLALVAIQTALENFDFRRAELAVQALMESMNISIEGV